MYYFVCTHVELNETTIMLKVGGIPIMKNKCTKFNIVYYIEINEQLLRGIKLHYNINFYI